VSSIKITIANQKGGVGKTTTAVTLAHGLALKNYNVLLADLDPQGQCASHLGMEQESGVFNLLCSDPRPPLRDVVRTATQCRTLYLLPGNKRTATAQTVLGFEGYDETYLAGVFGSPQFNSGRLHYVIMDTAPSTSGRHGLQEMALYAADVIVVPAAVDYLSLEGVAQILHTIKSLRRPHAPVLRVQPTFYDEVTKESATNLEKLREQFGSVVLDPIHRAATLRECPPLGKTIFAHQPNSRAATEYANLVWEVLDVSKQK
jgi:chromosome partitioning protein